MCGCFIGCFILGGGEGRGERCGFALGEKKAERLELDTAEGRGKECSVANSRTYRLPYLRQSQAEVMRHLGHTVSTSSPCTAGSCTC